MLEEGVTRGAGTDSTGGGGVSKATPEYFAHTCEPGPTIV